jgi:hypothetical protein
MPKCDFQVKMKSCNFPYVKSFENKRNNFKGSSKGAQRVQIPVLHALICSNPLLNLYGNAPETYDLRALRKPTTTQEKNCRKYLNSHYSRILRNPRRTHFI